MCDRYGYKANPRILEHYGTFSYGPSLKTIGETFEILPRDSFDFVPSKGYGSAHKLRQILEEEKKKKVSSSLRGTEHKEPHMLFENAKDAAEWAKDQLDVEHMKSLEVNQVPRPNESLVGKALTIEKSDKLVSPGNLVVCHSLEDETYLCHKPAEDVDITMVTVSPNGKPSTVWVACHSVDKYFCHVMNVQDMVFSVSALGSDGELMDVF